jgi:hypothetical protein
MRGKVPGNAPPTPAARVVLAALHAAVVTTQAIRVLGPFPDTEYPGICDSIHGEVSRWSWPWREKISELKK